MVELADTSDLGSDGEIRASSSLVRSIYHTEVVVRGSDVIPCRSHDL